MNRWLLVLILLAGVYLNIQTEAGESSMEKATFGAGCFWGVEKVFGDLPGVLSTQVGYTGGALKNPTYEQICNSSTGHAEAIEITYDPKAVEYAKLLKIYWHNIDPTVENAQFVDHGSQYRSAIFYHNEAQKKAAEQSKFDLAASKRFGNAPIMTEIAAAAPFYPAEDHHQKYYKKSPARYNMYHNNTGREEFKGRFWGKEEHE